MSISQDDFPARKNIPKLYKPYGKSKGNVGTLFDCLKSVLNIV